MILLGQHGQRQDYGKGLEYIRLAAQTCDENAPQGAYVSKAIQDGISAHCLYEILGLRNVACPRTSSSYSARPIPSN